MVCYPCHKVSQNMCKTPAHNTKGREYDTVDIKRQGQHKIPNTNMDRHQQDKSVHTAPAMRTCILKMPYQNPQSVL